MESSTKTNKIGTVGVLMTEKSSNSECPYHHLIGPKGPYIIVNNEDVNYEPVDDPVNDDYFKNVNTLNKLKEYVQYEQKSKEWLEQRAGMIGGSDSAAALGINHYLTQYEFIKKKLKFDQQIEDYSNMFWGNATEDIAVLLYEYLFNVKIETFGFIPHETIPFIGASPDGIVGPFKRDQIHKTAACGRMIEIKSLVQRKIPMNPNENKIEKIIPNYYITQVIQQLETCNLNECDFWQIKVNQYSTWEEYVKDRSLICGFKNSNNKFKGLFIQILPCESYTEDEIKNPKIILLDNKAMSISRFIHPPQIDMTPKELKIWYNKTKKENIPAGYFLFRPIFYYIDYARAFRVYRQNALFTDSYLPVLTKIYHYFHILQNDPIKRDLFKNICSKFEDSEKINILTVWRDSTRKEKINHEIMKITDVIVNNPVDSEPVQNILNNLNNIISSTVPFIN